MPIVTNWIVYNSYKTYGFVAVPIELSSLLSIHDSNENIGFVNGKSNSFYWNSGRITTFYW
jgi:hypothetical protein